MTKEQRKNLLLALKALEVKGKVEVTTKFDRSNVKVDGKYFGIFDHIKNTFVD